MAKIKKLTQDVIGQIAAGEVVERPAAALKELVENSLDAGATSVTVEIQDGGLTSFRVTDNGSGIAPEDLAMAFERHATSKLRTAEELAHVETLGFRGEALSSIAAVGRVRLTTRRPEQESGMRVLNEGGQILSIEEAACAEGTSIIVKDLFFNAPVRRGFMKKPQSETQQAAELMRLMILSHPDVSFRFKADGKMVYFSAGDGKIETAFMSVYGLQTLKLMKKVDFMQGGMLISGLVGVGDNARGNRAHQSFFINGRAMRSQVLSSALEEGCRQRVMIGRFPMCVLYIQMPFDKVDVNVHPNKWEVRFQDEKTVREAVTKAVQDALKEGAATYVPPPVYLKSDSEKMPEATVTKTPVVATPPVVQKDAPGVSSGPMMPSTLRDPLWEKLDQKMQQAAPVLPADQAPASNQAPAFDHGEQQLVDVPALKEKNVRLIGVAFLTYILFEEGDTLYLCDQHALHERLLFERLQKAYDTGTIAQTLLSPRAVQLSYREYGTFLEYQALLASAGFDAEDFGEQCVRLHALPLILGEPEAESSFRDALDVLEATGTYQDDKRLARLLQSACKHAVKGGERLPMESLRGLVQDMLTRDVIPTCPHGRPLMIQLTRQELEKRFGRVQP